MRTRRYFSHPIKAVNGRTVTTLFSVAGNIDSYSDRVLPGAFSKTIQERGSKVYGLWNHDFNSMPIASVKALREVSRDDLPDTVKSEYPDVTGGTEADLEFLDTARGDEALAVVRAGIPLEASFAFDVVKSDFTTEDGARIRNLREVRLYEVSLTLWGANSATVGAKSAIDSACENLSSLLEELKRRGLDNGHDRAALNDIATKIAALGANSATVAAKRAPTTKAITRALKALKASGPDLWEMQDECYDLCGGASAFASVAYLLGGECDDPAGAAPLIAALRMLLSFLDGEIAEVESLIAAGQSADMQMNSIAGIERQIKALLKAGARHSDADMKKINAMHDMAVDLGATNCAANDKTAPAPDESRAEPSMPVSLTLEKARLFLLNY